MQLERLNRLLVLGFNFLKATCILEKNSVKFQTSKRNASNIYSQFYKVLKSREQTNTFLLRKLLFLKHFCSLVILVKELGDSCNETIRTNTVSLLCAVFVFSE